MMVHVVNNVQPCAHLNTTLCVVLMGQHMVTYVHSIAQLVSKYVDSVSHNHRWKILTFVCGGKKSLFQGMAHRN